MLKPNQSKCWPPFDIKPRHPGQWPFSCDVTTRICRHAGREASAMLHAALHKNRSDGLDADAALQAVYYEPFTYWDWHGVGVHDESASKHKKQLLWERQRGFTANGAVYGYPSPNEAWLRFQTLIEEHTERRHWVKKIAAAHWMNAEDVSWIFKNLPSLEALDLGDIAYLGVQPVEGYARKSPETMTDTWALFFDHPREQSPAKDIASQLKWLGLPDFRDASLVAPQILLERLLPMCTNLQTLSIRGKYGEDTPPPTLDSHQYARNFSNAIGMYTPPSVTVLELRLSIPFLRELLLALHADSRLGIHQIGLDLGAWVQVYPLRIVSGEIQDESLISAASKAARKARFEIYAEEHNKMLSSSPKWLLPTPNEDDSSIPALLDMSDISGSHARPNFGKLGARPAFQHLFYGTEGGSDVCKYDDGWRKQQIQKKCANVHPKHYEKPLDGLENTHVNTLPAMLVRLHDAGRTAASQDYSLYSLQPEWQANSTTPLHPFTMIQKNQPLPISSIDEGRDYKEPLADRLKDACDWVNTTFTWRPVFDWDCFVRPDVKDVIGNLDTAFKGLEQQYGLKSDTKTNHAALVFEVAKRFRIMRDAGIPIHVLLGRRNSHESCLYWGWPYDSATWNEKLKAPFDAGLAPITAYIDTLSIFYDLRNPLDERRLREIDRRQHYLGPEACCPRPCPENIWPNARDNPFKKRWQDRPSRASKPNTQKTANKKSMGKKPIPLANNSSSCPPTGEYADEHVSDDLGSDKAIPETLHQVARRAAFEREAIGWQRFWTEYASQLTNLKELRVRMPHCFDQVSSWSLCKLLQPSKAWRMFAYADEREHMQTQEDLMRHVGDNPKLYTHAVQEQIWPAGRFVRRTWDVWTPDSAHTTEVVALERGTEAELPVPRPSGNHLIDYPLHHSKSLTEKGERREFEKAVKQARETAREEQLLEASLPPIELQHPILRNSVAASNPGDIERRLTGHYGRHIRTVAQRTWRAQIRSHVEELQDGEPARDEAVKSAIAMANESSASEAAITRDVLRRTRERLQERIQDFRPEDIFAPCRGLHNPNGVDLVEDTMDYAVEEKKRRAGLAKEDEDQTGKFNSKLPSTNTKTGALASSVQQPRASPVETSSETSHPESTSPDQLITTPRTVSAQGPQGVHTSQTTETMQQTPIARQLELAQQLADNKASRQATQKAVEKKAAEEDRRSEEQSAEKKRLVEEERAAIARAEAAKKKAVEEKKKGDDMKKQNAKIKKQAAAEKKKARDDVAAAKKKAKEDVAVAKKIVDEQEATRKKAEEKAANETSKATEIAAAKLKVATAAIKAINTEDIHGVVVSIEKTTPAKPTKLSNTSKAKSPKISRGTKRKENSAEPFDKPLSTKKSRPSKGPPATSTPVRRSSRIRTRTPTTQVELPSDVSATSSSEGDSTDDDQPKRGKKKKTGTGDAGDYESPGSTKKKTPTRGATKASRGRGKPVGRGGKATGATKRRKRVIDDVGEGEKDEKMLENKPLKKKPRKSHDEDEDEYDG